jgi:hypothetical protein
VFTPASDSPLSGFASEPALSPQPSQKNIKNAGKILWRMQVSLLEVEPSW